MFSKLACIKILRKIILKMSLVEIFGLTVSQIVGDVNLKEFANKGGIQSFVLGSLGYVAVATMMIVSLQNSSILIVNNAWNGLNSILENLIAYFYLEERFESIWQYIGILFIIFGIYLLKIPLVKNKSFHFPSFFPKNYT